MASEAKKLEKHEARAAEGVYRDCEVYKICCPKCSHVYFRLNYEDKECPKCRGFGEKVWGVRVAGGHFVVDQTIYDVLERTERKKKREGGANDSP